MKADIPVKMKKQEQEPVQERGLGREREPDAHAGTCGAEQGSVASVKTVSVLIPCYNEEENVVPMSEAVISEIMKLGGYNYELVYIDNHSTDSTREKIEALCAGNPRIKAIFNARNYGQFSSPYYGLLQTTGDCTISLCCDFQDPPEIIPQLVHAWENGAKVVCMVKDKSRENPFIRGMRSMYYRLMHAMSDTDQIEHFTGSGLYDRSFLDVLRTLDEPAPFLRGLVAELGFEMVQVPYTQQKRRAGKTKNSFRTLYDGAMLSFTSYTKTPLRAFSFIGLGVCALGVLGIIAFAICMGLVSPLYSTGLVISCMALFFGITFAGIGILGEYVLTLRSKCTKRPLVVEEKRINF